VTYGEYREMYGIKLNKQQEEAVLLTEGNTLLLAVPGSGKTTVIVSRLGYMIKCLGKDYRSILTLTYSVAACRDMKNRYISLFGDENVPQFRTIHGICALIIREYERQTGRVAFELIGGEKSVSAMLAEIFLRVNDKYPDPGQISELENCITYSRNMMLTKEQILTSFDTKCNVIGIMDEYAAEKKKRRLMDYDDQLEAAFKILKQCPTVRDAFRKRYRYINVDEAQDTSKLQHEIIAMLASGNLFMVGDEDQSIYGFRASYPRALLEFEKRYENAAVLFMEQNFRSTGRIIQRASALISVNRDRRSKNMFTEAEDGEDIEIMSLCSRRDQYSEICKEAVCVPQSTQTCAVLFRNNDSAIPLIAQLEKCGIPYRYREAECPFFENQAVNDVLALLGVVYRNDAESLLYVGTRLGCGFRREEIADMCRRLSRGLFYDILRKSVKMDDSRYTKICVLAAVMEKARLKKPAEAINLLYGDNCFARFLDVRFGDAASKIGMLTELAYDCDNFSQFREKMSKLRDICSRGSSPDGNCIILSTVHSSKGLEYDKVFIIDVKDGEFPCMENPERCTEAERETLEEERRLFYVAVTRARKKVCITRYAVEFDSSICAKSIFLRELMRYEAKTFKREPKEFHIPLPSLKEGVDVSLFKVGKKVIHRAFGSGVILNVEGDKCAVEFADGKKRYLSISVALQAGVIQIEE